MFNFDKNLFAGIISIFSEDENSSDFFNLPPRQNNLPGVFGHINPDRKWDNLDTLFLILILGCIFLKLGQNWITTGSPFVAHPDYTEQGIFWSMFDWYDTTSGILDTREDPYYYKEKFDYWQKGKKYWHWSENLEEEFAGSLKYYKYISFEDDQLLKKYRFATSEELNELRSSTLRRLRWARAHQYDKWLLLRKWKAKHELPDQGYRAEFWRDLKDEVWHTNQKKKTDKRF